MIFKAACIQINNQFTIEENLPNLEQLILDAKHAGADIIFTPENTDCIYNKEMSYHINDFKQENHKTLNFLRELAAKLNIWLNIGSLSIKEDENDKLFNRSFTIDNLGKIVSFYDKIHLFDCTLSNGEDYKESARFISGKKAVTTLTPWGKLGHTICYDLRFPQLFRKLALKGSDFIAVPAAFLAFTGEAHWHVLLRARAIETGCFIIAAAQTGAHGKRQSFGHSLIIDPWGNILADAGKEVGYICASLDLDLIHKTRKSIPSVFHNPEFE
jgi:predicted amidohydrolase